MKKLDEFVSYCEECVKVASGFIRAPDTVGYAIMLLFFLLGFVIGSLIN